MVSELVLELPTVFSFCLRFGGGGENLGGGRDLNDLKHPFFHSPPQAPPEKRYFWAFWSNSLPFCDRNPWLSENFLKSDVFAPPNLGGGREYFSPILGGEIPPPQLGGGGCQHCRELVLDQWKCVFLIVSELFLVIVIHLPEDPSPQSQINLQNDGIF